MNWQSGWSISTHGDLDDKEEGQKKAGKVSASEKASQAILTQVEVNDRAAGPGSGAAARVGAEQSIIVRVSPCYGWHGLFDGPGTA